MMMMMMMTTMMMMYHIFGLNVTMACGLYMGCKHIVLPSCKDGDANEDDDDYFYTIKKSRGPP